MDRYGWMLLLGALAVFAVLPACGSGQEGDSKPQPEPAAAGPVAVTFVSSPDATVRLNGEVAGTTPFEIALEPGEHEAVFEREGFLLETVGFDVLAGEPTTLEAALIIEDPNDEAALAALAQASGLEWDSIGEIAVHRGGGSGGIALYWPQGVFRLESLGTYRIDVDIDYEGDGFLEFKKGSKVLYREPFDPENIVTVANLPEAVLAEVKTNSVITWGITYDSRRQKPAVCQFKAVSSQTVDKAIAKLEKRKSFQKQPEIVKEIMRADILRNKKLHAEALIQYLQIVQVWPDSKLPYKGIAASAQRLDLGDTALFADAARLSATKGRGPGGAAELPASLAAPAPRGLIAEDDGGEARPDLAAHLESAADLLAREATTLEDASDQQDRVSAEQVRRAATAISAASMTTIPPPGEERERFLSKIRLAGETLEECLLELGEDGPAARREAIGEAVEAVELLLKELAPSDDQD